VSDRDAFDLIAATEPAAFVAGKMGEGLDDEGRKRVNRLVAEAHEVPCEEGDMSLKLRFAGVGSAFAPFGTFQTNAVLTDGNGRDLLIDCGSHAQFALAEAGVPINEIDGVYVTHLHADHVGGMEWLAFNTFFNPSLEKPKLYANYSLMSDLWYRTLSGGLDSIEGKIMDLGDYFDCRPVRDNGEFKWGGVRFFPTQTVHIMAGRKIVNSYGLMMCVPPDSGSGPWKRRIFYTGDTQFAPNQIRVFYEQADLIFQDCEMTTGFKSGVHAHYEDLLTLPDEIRAKMWLMHYQVDGRGGPLVTMEQAEEDGFAGVVTTEGEWEI